MKRTIVAACIACLPVAGAFGAFSVDDAGTSGYQFLKIGIGARAAAMGEAQTAVSSDANALYWNPAGLAPLDRREIAFNHAAWFQDISYQSVVYVEPTVVGAFAASVNYLSMAPVTKFTNEGVELNESYIAQDAALTLGYATVWRGMQAGASVKYLASYIEEDKAIAIAADAGLICPLGRRGFRVGIVAQNMGISSDYIRRSDPLPFALRVGAGYPFTLRSTVLLTALDVSAPIDNDPQAHLGVEAVFRCSGNITLTPRVGYKTRTRGLESLAGVSTGIGIRYRDLSMDYAFAPYGDLGETHRITVGLRFTPSMSVRYLRENTTH